MRIKKEEDVYKLFDYLNDGKYYSRPYEELISFALVTIKAEHHRHYHTLKNHIFPMLEWLSEEPVPQNAESKLALFFATLYHDIVYEVKHVKPGDNEERSFRLWSAKAHQFKIDENIIRDVCTMILNTATHQAEDPLSERFLRLDLRQLTLSFEKVLKDEALIRKEYEWADWNKYKERRIEVLRGLCLNEIVQSLPDACENINMQIEYLKFYTPRIAIYPGSFRRFHLGHMNVLEKAEQIFDKVIVIFTKDAKKDYSNRTIPKALEYKQVVETDNWIQWMNELPYPVTIVRGLRDSYDLAYEQKLLYWWKQMSYKRINTVNIFCDEKYQQLSSSAIDEAERLSPAVARQFYYE